MMRSTSRILPLLTAVLLSSACGSDDGAADSVNEADDATASSDSSSAGAGSTLGTSTGNVQTTPGAAGSGSLCSNGGPQIAVIDDANAMTYQKCAGQIAETRFMNALCTCNDATVAGYLKTTSFDSVNGGPTDTGGSVGINHIYKNTTGFTDIGGALTIAGQDPLSFAGYLQVGSDFKAASDVTVAGYTKVWSDAWLGGSFTDLGPVEVKGDLHSAGTMIAFPLLVSGTTTQQSVAVEKPCPCEPKDLLNIGAIVADGKANNDNAAHGIRSDMLNLAIGDVEVTLPCGRFFFDRIGGAGNVIVNVTGRVAVFVDGPIEAVGNVEFRLTDTAEVDIFVKGDLVLVGRAVFGKKERPSASRIYVGGSGDVLLIGADGFVGNVYAPKSKVTAVGYLQMYGSLVAKDFVIPGYANFGYDRSIQHVGDSCTPGTPEVPTIPFTPDDPGTPTTDTPSTPGLPTTPPSCNKCGTCSSGSACVNGSCGSCRNDGDCCSPYVCQNGMCAEELVIR